jgi:hypothetical protein
MRAPASQPAARAAQPRQTLPFARRDTLAAKAVGSFLPRLTAKAFEKFGFSTASLVTDWPTIAGRELAACSLPERLRWPPRQEVGDDEARASRTRKGATLVLRVEGARALDVQYKSRQIIERINAYFGYAAVAELRIVQAPLPSPRPGGQSSSPRSVPAATPQRELAGIADAALREALSRLGSHVRPGR